MVMNVMVLGACAVSFAMKMLRLDPPEAEKKEILDEAASVGEDEELETGLAELEETNTSIEEIKAFLKDKETELQTVMEENENLRSKVLLGSQKIAGFEDTLVKMEDQLDEINKKIEDANVREKETSEKLRLLQLVLEDSNERASITVEQLELVKAAKMPVETEIKKNRIQTQQWGKVADAATTVLQDTAQQGESDGEICLFK